jgi:hypothetical protein
MLPLTHINTPLGPYSFSPLSLNYLLGEPSSLFMVRIPIHSCPWSADNCPTYYWLTHPNTPHISSYNIYIDDINNASRPRWAQYIPITYVCLSEKLSTHIFTDLFLVWTKSKNRCLGGLSHEFEMSFSQLS